MDAISKNIANSNEDITKILANVDKLTEELSSADFKGTVGKTNKMIDQTSMTMEDLNKTIASMDKTINNLNSLTGKMNDGQGTMGKLMNDKSLYENLDETSKNLSLLLQDLRLNPKRYVNVSVFGKKQKEYKLPEEDPALNK
jgi:phospholipid/cholesterol/gamma-HCH transport system substrate-binding protein